MARTDQRAVPLTLIAIVFALLAARTASHFVTEPANATLVRWVSIEEGVRIAATTDKPILLFFTAEWCGPCHMLESEVFSNPEIARDINERVIPIRVLDRKREEGRNSEPVDQLEQRYAIRGFPTLVFVDAFVLARRSRGCWKAFADADRISHRG
jgi:thioredoxin-related protein